MLKKSVLYNTLFILFSLQAAGLTYIAYTTTPNQTEIGHVGKMVYYWKLGQTDLFVHNPPLVHFIAGVPYYLGVDTAGVSLKDVYIDPQKRSEFDLGRQEMPLDRMSLWALSRIILIPLILFGGWCGYKLASKIYGSFRGDSHYAGLGFLTLWVFSPMVLGWGATIGTDVPAAAMGLIGFYTLWRWFAPNYENNFCTVTAGFVLGLMLLTKFVWVIAVPIYLGLWCFRKYQNKTLSVTCPHWGHLVGLFFTAWLTVNLAYFCNGTFTPLKDYRFVSNAMTGIPIPGGESPSDIHRNIEYGNKYKDLWVGCIPVPFPRDFVAGLDAQKSDFETGYTSYLNGTFSNRGWCYYYAESLLLKEPIGMIVLFFFSIILFCYSPYYRTEDTWANVFILAPMIMFFVFVSSQYGFSEHTRYMIPVLPFAYLFVARNFKYLTSAVPSRDIRYFKRVVLTAGLISLAGFITSSVRQFPHEMSYCNELIKPAERHKYLLGSNWDWGQNGYEIKRWVREHGYISDYYMSAEQRRKQREEKEPFYISYSTTLPFEQLNIKDDGDVPKSKRFGWFLVEVNALTSNPDMRWLLKEEPVEVLGGSVYVYHITR
jgi:hypothetical protein